MNIFLEKSLDYAANRSYLDDLYRVYQTIPNGIRDINEKLWGKVEEAFTEMNNYELVLSLLKFEHFPIKDSYVSFLRRDKNAMERNPRTVNRLAGALREMGLDRIYQVCSEPKETNRQIGPMFKNWVNNGNLGLIPVSADVFLSSSEDAILQGSDKEMAQIMQDLVGYDREKGLDFVARINGRYIIGEAKFLKDFGGHQNAQFNDAMTIFSSNCVAIKVAILDGVCYILGRSKMYEELTGARKNQNIMSALLLRDFIYSI